MAEVAHRALHHLEDDRRILIQESERIQLELGRLRRHPRRRIPRYRRGDLPRINDSDSEGLKQQLVGVMRDLRALNQEIKAERRRLTTLLEEGSPRPRTAFQYVVALYRLFDDAVPPDQRSATEQAIMRRAQDFVMRGVTDRE